MPNHPVTQAMIEQLGVLIGPSANLSGNESGKQFAAIQAQFSADLLGIEDDQALTGVDSTILDLSGDKVKILRQGAIKREEIIKAVPDIRFEESDESSSSASL